MFEGEGKSAGAVSPIEHIDLARWPDLIVIAPATQNTIAALTHGRADDLLATIVSAYRGPVMLAPAMNDVMWENPATQENLRVLSGRGFRVAPPERGDLACGYEATGRMAEPETIFAAVRTLFESSWRGRRVLVSVGGTEEDIDPVRVISNRSSGKMGFAVAEAARDLGAEVTVVAARTSVAAPHGVRIEPVRTSEEMSRVLKKEFAGADLLVMTAAVTDFRPAAPLSEKKKSSETWSLDLVKTEDILESLGAAKGSRVVVGFALETENEEANARAKMQKKLCDLMVLNRPEAAFGKDTNVVTIYGASGVVYRSAAPESKRELARRILELASPLVKPRST
jgi:phosphopantothenoylcysteine decarboxylase/phosphopantothenate--cysteine ligase